MNTLNSWKIDEKDFPKGNRREQIKFLLRYNILSPSRYNRQPWKFRIVDDETVEFFLDLDRHLPVADSFRYEMLFSAGATLKMFLIAAEYFGFKTKAFVFPESETRPDMFARVILTEGGIRSSQALLCREITKRNTARGDFVQAPIDSKVIDELIKSIADFDEITLKLIDEDDEKSFIADIVEEADKKITSNENYHAELKNWLRTNYSNQNDGLPAYVFGISSLSSLLFPNLLYKRILDPIGGTKGKLFTERAPLIAVIGTTNDIKPFWLHTGGAFITLSLTAAKYKLTASTYDLLFNVPELTNKLKQYIEETRYGVFYPRMIIRLGYAMEYPQTPRRPLEEFLIEGDALPPAPKSPVFGKEFVNDTNIF